MDHHQNSRELEGKSSHDPMNKVVWVPHPIIVGAGPSGLAVAACLKSKGIHSLVLERSSCIASLWQLKTYDRLKLHLPKHFCQLPIMPFPQHFPNYPSRTQFLDYLHSYAERFEIKPVFDRKVSSAELAGGWWRVRTEEEGGGGVVEYASRWLVVATGENADEAVPFIEGMEEFGGESMMIHTSEYRNGEGYEGKKVCVVGCGNSGMEVALDLCNHNADPRLVVKGTVHILPREMLGMSTFGLSMWLLKWFNVRLVDRFLLTVSRFVIGDTGRFGIVRPGIGPLELKGLTGKTPVLDVGTLDKIRSGHIKIRPGIRRLLGPKFVEFEDGTTEIFDAIILATGYKSNVPSWLNENKMFSKKDGFPKQPFPNGWKGEHGLYAAGFAKRGLLGTSIDAKNIADDLEASWREEKKPCFF